jgi:hypothetical protein
MDWETAIGEVIEGYEETIKELNSEYKEKPSQGRIHSGPEYINQEYPNMDSFGQCTVQRRNVDTEGAEEGSVEGGSNLGNVATEKKMHSITGKGSEKNDAVSGRLGAISGGSTKDNFPLFLLLVFLLGLVVAAKKKLLGLQRRKKN